jgi:hypothetical protein
MPETDHMTILASYSLLDSKVGVRKARNLEGVSTGHYCKFAYFRAALQTSRRKNTSGKVILAT